MRTCLLSLMIKTGLVAALFLVGARAFGQQADSTRKESQVSGAVSVTNKGISTIPTFTLGKPAVIVDLSVGKGKLAFEPQLRFALEGKPWSFLFWWRYKALAGDKFQLTLGAHPALAFKNIPSTKDGVTRNVMVAHRYLAGELVPNYTVTRNISVGPYYLYSHGLEKGIVRHTHFLALRSTFSHIRLSAQYALKFSPQVYYLNMDKKDGFYTSSTLTVARHNFPLSLSVLVNRKIQTTIPVGQDLLWNATLVYSFHKKYAQL